MIERDELDCKMHGKGPVGTGRAVERRRSGPGERERGLVQGNEEAERVLSDGVLPEPWPAALLFYCTFRCAA